MPGCWALITYTSFPEIVVFSSLMGMGLRFATNQICVCTIGINLEKVFAACCGSLSCTTAIMFGTPIPPGFRINGEIVAQRFKNFLAYFQPQLRFRLFDVVLHNGHHIGDAPFPPLPYSVFKTPKGLILAAKAMVASAGIDARSSAESGLIDANCISPCGSPSIETCILCK